MTYRCVDEETNVADAIITALADGGIEYVLGMAGGLTLPLWQALYQHPRVKAILVRENPSDP